MADLDAILTDRFALAETGAAMEKALMDKVRSLKVMVYPNGLGESGKESRT